MRGINHLVTLLCRWLRPPTIADDEDQTRVAALLHTVLLALLAIGGGGLAILPFVDGGLGRGLFAGAGAWMAYLGLLLLLRRGLVWLACGLFVGMHWLAATLAAISYGGVASPAMISYFSMVAVTGMLLGGRAAIGVAGLSALAGGGLLAADARGWLVVAPHAGSSSAIWWAISANMLLVATLQALADRSLRLALRRARRSERALAERNEELGREIAERQRIADEHEALIAGLRAKNTELDRFTHTVSHDLKSPLITIQGFLGLLEKDAPSGDGERLRRNIERIRENAARMQRLIDDLLRLAQVGQAARSFQPIAFAAVVHEARQLVAWSLESAEAELSVDEALPVVYGDHTRLVEVVQNLIENAVKFRRPRRQLQITIGHDGREGDLHRLFVRDNGVGIAPQYREQIFELFTRLDAQGEGTGIGLTLVRQIIDAHGGRVWVESEGLHRGCTFWLTLRAPPGPG